MNKASLVLDSVEALINRWIIYVIYVKLTVVLPVFSFDTPRAVFTQSVALIVVSCVANFYLLAIFASDTRTRVIKTYKPNVEHVRTHINYTLYGRTTNDHIAGLQNALLFLTSGRISRSILLSLLTLLTSTCRRRGQLLMFMDNPITIVVELES